MKTSENQTCFVFSGGRSKSINEKKWNNVAFFKYFEVYVIIFFVAVKLFTDYTLHLWLV